MDVAEDIARLLGPPPPPPSEGMRISGSFGSHVVDISRWDRYVSLFAARILPGDSAAQRLFIDEMLPLSREPEHTMKTVNVPIGIIKAEKLPNNKMSMWHDVHQVQYGTDTTEHDVLHVTDTTESSALISSSTIGRFFYFLWLFIIAAVAGLVAIMYKIVKKITKNK